MRVLRRLTVEPHGYHRHVAITEVLGPFLSMIEEQPIIEAAAVVGSQVTGFARSASDIDVFVYVADSATVEETLSARHAFAAQLADPTRVCVVQQTGHPHADVWALDGSSTYLDLMFWSEAWAREELEWRLVRCEPQVGGASTAFWRSIRDGIPIFDRRGWLAAIQERARSPYPDELRAAVLRDAVDLLGTENSFSFRNQVAKVITQGDAVAAHHRTAKWIETYFNALFAANRVLHPGQKRLVQ